MAEYPIIKEGECYLSIETEHFYFDVYKAWNGTGGGSMFRAGSYIKKKGGKKYYIDYELFAEWDYKDKQTAFEEAKAYIFGYMKHLSKELLPSADVEEVKHGEWGEIKQGYGIFDYCFKCSNCGKTTPPNAFAVAPDYCPRCGAKMDKGDAK